jgi:hypothetical protein
MKVDFNSRIKTMNMKLISISIAAILFSCGVKKLQTSTKTVAVKGTIQTHQPYCGGAKPTEEMMKGTTTLSANQTFYLKPGISHVKKEPVFMTFKTDENGQFNISVPMGDYVVLSQDKIDSYEAYLKKYKVTSTYVEYLGDECSKRNYEAADFILRVQSDTTVVYTYKSRCQTGTNPCLRYTGPQAQ